MMRGMALSTGGTTQSACLRSTRWHVTRLHAASSQAPVPPADSSNNSSSNRPGLDGPVSPTPAGKPAKPSATSDSSSPEKNTDPQKPRGLGAIILAMLETYAKFIYGVVMKICTLALSPFNKLLQGPGNSVGRFALLFFMLMLVQGWHGSMSAGKVQPTEVPYSTFVKSVRSGLVHSALVDDHAHTLYFLVDPSKGINNSRRWFRKAVEGPPPATPAKMTACTTKLIDRDTSFIKELVSNDVTFGVKKQTLSGTMGRLFGGFLALWIPLIPFIIIFKRIFDSQNGKSKNTKQSFAPPDTTFADVAGVDVVKAELEEAIQCLKNPGKFEKLNAQMPSGVLLSGPPGTGKTLLARAVAGEAGVPFFAVSASEFVEMFVGRGAARIRELFAQARKAAPSVVFIDELDAVGSKRGLGVNDERDQTLNQLLTELDGFERRPQVLLLAATNRPEVLDPALLRPGRISRRIVVPLPDQSGRRDILRVHLRSIPMESDEFKAEAIDYLSSLTFGFSGAELYNVVNEGALLAARRSEEVVSLTDLVNGVQRTRNGVNAPGGGGLGGVVKKLAEMVTPKAPSPARSSTMV